MILVDSVGGPLNDTGAPLTREKTTLDKPAVHHQFAAMIKNIRHRALRNYGHEVKENYH